MQMLRFLLVSLTGWLAVIAVATEIALPYIIRDKVRSGYERVILSGGAVTTANLQERMGPHYWLGYSLAGLALVHSSLVMGPAMARSDTLGIWAATLAFCMLLAQIGLGLILKSNATSGTFRRRVRSMHFWSMIMFLTLLTLHVFRNSR